MSTANPLATSLRLRGSVHYSGARDIYTVGGRLFKHCSSDHAEFLKLFTVQLNFKAPGTLHSMFKRKLENTPWQASSEGADPWMIKSLSAD